MGKSHDWMQFIGAVRNDMGLLPRSLRSRIAVTFGLLALSVGLPAYFFISHIYLDQLTQDKREKLQVIAEAAATIVGQSLAERRREVGLLAESKLLATAPLDSEEVKTSLEHLKRSRTHYSWIGVVDAEGVVMSSTSNLLKGTSVSARPWFIQGRDHIYVGDLHEAVLLSKLLVNDQPGQPMRFIDFAAPILTPDGKTRAAIGAHAHWRWANEVMAMVGDDGLRKDKTDIFIVNSSNAIIFPADMPGLQQVPADVSDGKPFHMWSDGQEFLTMLAKVPEVTSDSPLGWKIYVRQPKAAVVEIVANLQVVMLLASLVAGSVFLLFSWINADRIARPLEKLTEVARRIQAGQEQQKFDVSVNSLEIMELQGALSAMSTTLVERKQALERSNTELEDKVRQRTQALQHANQTLEQLAKVDALTGLPNRLASDEKLKEEFAQMKRGKAPYALLMTDVDNFKRINDTWGHAIGDAVLKHVADTVRGSLRDTDFVGRVGGEEFLIVLPMTDHAMGLKVAEKVRATVASSVISPVGHVTISMGLEQAHPLQKNEQEALRGADEWLYQAKKSGKNRVESIDTPIAPSS